MALPRSVGIWLLPEWSIDEIVDVQNRVATSEKTTTTDRRIWRDLVADPGTEVLAVTPPVSGSTRRKLPIGQVGDCRDCGCPGSPREDGARAVSENRSPACRMAVDGAPENADLGQFALLTIRADAGFCGQVISDQIVGVPDRSGSRADCCVRSMRIGGARERPGSDPGSRIFVC